MLSRTGSPRWQRGTRPAARTQSTAPRTLKALTPQALTPWPPAPVAQPQGPTSLLGQTVPLWPPVPVGQPQGPSPPAACPPAPPPCRAARHGVRQPTGTSSLAQPPTARACPHRTPRTSGTRHRRPLDKPRRAAPQIAAQRFGDAQRAALSTQSRGMRPPAQRARGNQVARPLRPLRGSQPALGVYSSAGIIYFRQEIKQVSCLSCYLHFL